jgi:hypothetical protein
METNYLAKEAYNSIAREGPELLKMLIGIVKTTKRALGRD